MADTKKCGRCGETKSVEEFHANKNMGHSSYCKPCQSEYMREYYRKNRDKIKRQATEYYRVNRDEKLKYQKGYHSNPENKRRWKCLDLQRRLGVTLDWYEETLKSQGGVCAICKTSTEETEGRRLAVDHCHETGRVRGVLCTNCNKILGHAKDSTKVLLAAAAYLELTGDG